MKSKILQLIGAPTGSESQPARGPNQWPVCPWLKRHGLSSVLCKIHCSPSISVQLLILCPHLYFRSIVVWFCLRLFFLRILIQCIVWNSFHFRNSVYPVFHVLSEFWRCLISFWYCLVLFGFVNVRHRFS